MNITSIVYAFHGNQVIVKVPFEIIKETEKCFFTKHGRYLKSEINVPMLRSSTAYPYIELVMVDTDEQTLRAELSKWFTNKAHQIKEEV
jgi:hypothetical protein